MFSSWGRHPVFEVLEERAMLSAAQDIQNQIAPYQNAFNTALDVATSLPLVGQQFKDLQELDTTLTNALTSIEAQTQNLTSGHFQRAIPLPSISQPFTFNLGLDSFLQFSTSGGVAASLNPVLNVGFDYQNGTATINTAETNLDLGFSLALPNFQASLSFNHLLTAHAVDQGTNFNGHLKFAFGPGNSLSPQFSGDAHIRLGFSLNFVDPALNPAAIIGSTMTASHGGLMVGGPGNNSFIATGPGNYEMIGGTWLNTFSISPAFGGIPATYQIDGAPTAKINSLSGCRLVKMSRSRIRTSSTNTTRPIRHWRFKPTPASRPLPMAFKR